MSLSVTHAYIKVNLAKHPSDLMAVDMMSRSDHEVFSLGPTIH